MSARSSSIVPTLRPNRVIAPGAKSRSRSSGAVSAVVPAKPTAMTARASAAGSSISA
jgi:hypothetical protein